MIAKGVQNLESTIEACQGIFTALAPDAEAEWKDILQSIIDVGEDLKTKFFLKTNLAVPVTSACLKSARELEEITAGDLSRFPEVLTDLKANVEKLLDGADMGGIVIT